jgi:hypothetical protein
MARIDVDVEANMSEEKKSGLPRLSGLRSQQRRRADVPVVVVRVKDRGGSLALVAQTRGCRCCESCDMRIQHEQACSWKRLERYTERALPTFGNAPVT